MVHLKFFSKEITPITREQQCNNEKFVLTRTIINIFFKYKQVHPTIYLGYFEVTVALESVNISNFQYKYSWNE